MVCSITGFTIIATGAWTRADAVTGKALTGAPLTMAAFRTGLPGEWGGIIVSVGLALFAFSTILGWAYYGERALEYLLGRRVIAPFRLLFVVGAFVRSYVLEFGHAEGLELVWTFSDVMNGAMALPNLVGLVLLVPVVVAETRATVWPSRSHLTDRG